MIARRSTRRSRVPLLVGLSLVGLVGSAGIVWQASYSAFSATTANPTNNWAVGSVVLSDDDSNTAMFNATGLKPSSTGTKCIAVTSTGTLPSSVKLYGTNLATTNGLSAYVQLTINIGTGGAFSSCTGFSSTATVYSGTVAGFGAAATSYATGLGTWTPTGSASESRTYQFIYTIDPAAPNTTQGGTAAIGFTWEVQNT